MTVYVDIVLAENVCMNYIILFSTGYIIKLKMKKIRILLSSFIGAIYAILAYMEIFPLYTNITVKFILSVCMIYIAFKPKNIKIILKELIIFYLVSFTLGGCTFALLYIVKPQDIFIKNGVYIGTYPIKIALLGGMVGFTVTYTAFKSVKTKINKNELIYEIEIKINEKKVQTKVMLDTGNMLKDPISNKPVIIVEKKVLYKIVPKALLENSKKILGGEFENKCDITDEYRKRLRIIPFTSVGKQNGMMLGIKVDEINIITDIDKIKNEDIVLCIYEKEFNKKGKYYGIIGIELLE